ncbi:MAG: HD domain-containing phosphohydrolase [Nitrospinota bacterium]
MVDSASILIVDDIEVNRTILKDIIIALGHTPILAENGLSALAQMKKRLPDLVLLDILMPEMDGHEVMSRMKGDAALRNIPIIIISAVDQTESVVSCIEKGADDYMIKPFNGTFLKARIGASLEKKRLRDSEEKYRLQIEDSNQNLEKKILEQVQRITSHQTAIIFALAKLSESRDPETGEHLERMAEYSRILCERLRQLPKYQPVIDEKYITNIYGASPLHDIGKVGIPDKILTKPGKLSKQEFEIMKTHSMIGADTLREVDYKHPGNEFVLMGIEIAESHHEKWDGTGYPYGLAGENIPLAGRILALGDVYDALTSRRAYKEAFSHEKSREIIIEGRGTHFDPDMVDVFISAEQEFLSIKERFVDSE